MSDVPGLYRQGRPVPSPFPPHPNLELRGRYGRDVFLIVPHSPATHEVQRFQVFEQGWHRDVIGNIQLGHLLDELGHGYSPFGSGTSAIDEIRHFYMAWRHVAPMEQPRALVDLLKRDIERGTLAVFRFQRDPHWGIIRRNPGEPVPQPDGLVATWDGRQKIVAMFQAIPDFLEGAAKAEFKAFLSPENLTIMAVFLVGIGELQATPGVDAAVDGMIAGLAWWQFGWAGLIAGKDFIEAVIKADQATTHEEILLAAKLAAAALVSLGITVLLKKVTENVHQVKWAAKEEPLPKPVPEPSPQQRALSQYGAGQTKASDWSKFENLKQVDPNNLSQGDLDAKENLTKLGYVGKYRDQILNSGDNFDDQYEFNTGQNLYKFTSDGYVPNSDNAYYLDQNGFDDVQSQFFNESSSSWDNAGIKTYLALPCYNQANAIVQGTVTDANTGLSSTIGPATENFMIPQSDGSILDGVLPMAGGGTQVTPALGSVGPLTGYVPK